MDHCKREKRQTNPRETANIFSLFSFTYIISLFKKGIKKDLIEDDIYEVLKQHRSEKCGNALETEWIKQKKKHQKPSTARLIWKCYGKRYLLIGLIDFVYNTTNSIVRPNAISNFVLYFTPGQTTVSRNDVYFYAACILFLHVFSIVYNHNYMIWVQMFGMEIRTGFSSLLYRKALKLSPTAVAETNLGNIVTLITRDVQSFVSVIFSINDTWISMTQVLVICYLLFNKVGPVSFVGIGILLSAVPMQAYLGSWITKFRLETSKKTDKRLQASQEILSTIRIIKMYTWENFFNQHVNATRKEEMKKLILGFYFRKVLIVSGVLFSNLGFYMLIVATVWAGISTDTSIIFYIISAFRDLKHFLAVVVPLAMGMSSEFISSYKRISTALEADEMAEKDEGRNYNEKPLVEFNAVTVRIQDAEILKDITFKITSGLTVITGMVGSGKSSLLKTILKDLPLKSGSVKTQGRISYASQEPWLFPSTIKQNILFGEPFDATRYLEVVKACALIFDFSLFEKGDETILSDQGLNLSKGQRARINLARAVYRKSEIYLLDDSLTALDPSVQEYIFFECIQKFLGDKICILVTQTTNQIQAADTVIILDNGSIKDLGEPTENILKEVDELIEDEKHNSKENEENMKDITEKSKLIETEKVDIKIYSEIKKQGSVDWQVYKKYFLYGGGYFLILFNILMRGGTQFTNSSYERLLTEWVDNKQVVLNMENSLAKNSSSVSLIELEEQRYLEKHSFQLYSIFIVVASVLEMVTTYFLMDFCRRASTNLHKKLITNIINSVMRFFDTHFIGNILNRLSQDMFNVDENISNTLDQCARSSSFSVGIIILVATINPSFAIISGIVLVCAFSLRNVYLPAGRSLKRLEASTRSPMVGHLNATLDGLTTVRASHVQKKLIEEYDKHQDLYTSANFTSTCSARAYGFFVDVLCSSLMMYVIFKALFFSSNTAGDIGLSITQVSLLTMMITWSVRQFTELENFMTSFERVLEYTDIKTEQKGGSVIENWPRDGSICYENVFLSYENNDNFVLKNINFEIKAKEKIGIVGRTGAGKSSILSTIFRLYDVNGKIFIDGVDTKTLALDFLRKNIVVIPQDPIIFSGTIRSNLDPLSEYKDKELWNALERVGMKHLITGLEQHVEGCIMNFSAGQKQLLCLARAILRKNKIVVMDEATANMDHETDQILHKIIKDNFSDCTVLTIAHRLHSVLECDKVMVLDRGEIKEFDKPAELLKNKQGMFYNMVKHSGLLN